jgi:DNA-binding CsgD family transcriptional regulator
MVAAHTALAAARSAYARRDWPAAREGFRAAHPLATLTPEDLGAWSDAAWWLGDTEESLAVGRQAYEGHRRAGAPREAATAALGIAYLLFLQARDALGAGWLSRARRLLADQAECVEQGYLRYVLEVEPAFAGGDPAIGVTAARSVRDLGLRHGDRTLVALGTFGEGRVLVRHGRVADGVVLLDEAMVAVASEELDPEWAGNLYCHMMSASHELCDIDRARQWTDATSRWLAALPAAVLFTGICRVHRSQVLQTRGDWDAAAAEAAQVCLDLAEVHVGTAAEGHYQLGDLHRLRGDVDAAERCYERARECGRDPQPGRALLLLARGHADAASASIQAALVAQRDAPLARARLCAAQVEIALAASDLPTAAKACDELAETAAVWGGSGLPAMARLAEGRLALAAGHPLEALPLLRTAAQCWRGLAAPHEAATAGVLLAQAYLALGDTDAAAHELTAAEAAFRRLGAGPDLARAAALHPRATAADGLTAREVEVLRLVAAGLTNRAVAGRLRLSEKTVARHLSNLFTKLGLSSRTQAAAYAYERGLLPRDGGAGLGVPDQARHR